MTARILNEETEHEAWFIELLAKERDNKIIPSAHFRRGAPGDAPYSKNRGFGGVTSRPPPGQHRPLAYNAPKTLEAY